MAYEDTQNQRQLKNYQRDRQDLKERNKPSPLFIDKPGHPEQMGTQQQSLLPRTSPRTVRESRGAMIRTHKTPGQVAHIYVSEMTPAEGQRKIKEPQWLKRQYYP